ncbi:MAG: hypothetical protein WC969_09885 [Elusimicrobiota bacterium]|jgi:hypothetical protein
MDRKTERLIYNGVFAAALLLAALLLVSAGRRLLARWKAPAPPAAAVAAAPDPMKDGMSRVERPMPFIPPVQLIRRAPQRRASAPPAVPAPPITPDKRK